MIESERARGVEVGGGGCGIDRLVAFNGKVDVDGFESSVDASKLSG